MIPVDIKGRVKDHTPKLKECNILTASGSIYSLNYTTFFMPIDAGDFIYAKCNFKNNDPQSKSLILIAPPLVQLGIDEACIKHSIQIGAGKYFSDQRTTQVYDKLHEEAKTKDKIASVLDKLAETYYNTKSEGVLMHLSPMCNITQAQALLQWWYKKRVLRQLYLFGLNNNDINNLKERFNTEEIYKHCVENPYLLTDVKIEKCDEILMRQNKQIDSYNKMVAILAREIERVCTQRGYTGIPTWLILKMWPDILNFMEPLKVNYGVVADLETVYPNMNYEAEVNVTNRIVELLKSDPYQFGEVKVYDEKATPDQREAVAYALNNWITIINGDAGSGKSTTIKEIILNLEERKIPYECGSFTGKACSRLRSILGKNHPKTLDRLISQGSGTDFEWYIADEVSMFALLLMHRFFKKFTHKFHLIIVADQKQLLPIGVGNFYIQLLIAGIIPTRTLTQNHRIMNSNGEINKIITNSLGLFNTPDGEYFEFQTGPEFQLYHNDSMEPVSNILKMLKDLKVEAKDIQIITYYTKHIPKLNKAFQEIYKTSDEFCIDSKGRVILKGDRVFHNKNDPENNLANGDIGIVTYVSTDKIKVHFEAYDYTETFTTAIMTDPMDYKERDVSNLDIGFACSIDKFQGSEAKYIILYCPSDPVNKSFLNYNRLYTTFTRARVAFFAVGNINELLVGARTSPKFVHEKLAQRIRLAMKLPAVAEVVIEEDYNYD